MLATAGLLLKSLVLLRNVDTGFETRRLITAMLPLPETSYGTPVRRQSLVDALTERLQHLPGVESTGFTNSMALAGMFMMSGDFTIEGMPRTDPAPEANLVAASAGYFHATGMPLLAGRYFTDAEALKGEAALVNEAAARKFFGGPQQAVGHRINSDFCNLVPDRGGRGQPEKLRPQERERTGNLHVAIQHALPGARHRGADVLRSQVLDSAVRAAISAVAPDLALERIRSMREVLGEHVAYPGSMRFWWVCLRCWRFCWRQSACSV